MKKTIITLALSALAVTAYAEERTNHEICTGWADLAQNVMRAHQNGAPISEGMEILKDNAYARRVLIDAYDQPRYSTADYQDRAVSRYRDQVYVDCILALEGE